MGDLLAFRDELLKGKYAVLKKLTIHKWTSLASMVIGFSLFVSVCSSSTTWIVLFSLFLASCFVILYLNNYRKELEIFVSSLKDWNLTIKRPMINRKIEKLINTLNRWRFSDFGKLFSSFEKMIKERSLFTTSSTWIQKVNQKIEDLMSEFEE